MTIGLEEGLRRAVLGAILVRFERVPDAVREAVGEIRDADALVQLHEAVLRADSLEAFHQHLATT